MIAETFGNASRIASGSAPMPPVTMTRPFSAIAEPIASSDSFLALSRKPQVLTITASAPAWLFESSYPSARSRVRMRSESTGALGHPSERKEMRGAGAFMPVAWHGRPARATRCSLHVERERRPRRHDAGRVDELQALVIMMLNVEQIDCFLDPRPSQQIEQEALQSRIILDAT